MSIKFVKGDATAPEGQGTRIITHVCNDRGRWGKGFVMALTKRWPEPEAQFRRWHKGETEQPFALGEVQMVQVEPALWVANLIGQKGMTAGKEGPPIRYAAIETGLQRVAKEAARLQASVHMPRIGCGLAGGKWEKIEPIIDQALGAAGIQVTVYDF